MGVQIITERPMTRPSTTPLKSSVLDHASVTEKTDGFNLRNEEGLWPSYNCLDTLASTPMCPDPPSVDPKTFSVAGWQPGFSFAVYGGAQCALLGLDQADQERELARVFQANEGKGVERALLETRFVAKAPEAEGHPGWDAPVDLTPVGVKISLPVAFALLEGYAASVYAGTPIIHMSRTVASLLGADKVVWEGDKAYSRLGSRLALGGGYDGDPATWNGEWTLYATGEIAVERSDTLVHSEVEMFGSANLDANTKVALVERMYRVGVDCFVAKATGTVWTV